MIYGEYGFIERFAAVGKLDADEVTEFVGMIDAIPDVQVMLSAQEEATFISKERMLPFMFMLYPPCEIYFPPDLPKSFLRGVEKYATSVKNLIENRDKVLPLFEELLE